MKKPNLNEIISISDFKKQASQILNQKETKVIMKNNEPLSVIIPYEEYLKTIEEAKQELLRGIGQDITMKNGVKLMVCVETEEDTSREGIAIKVYKKMQTSGDYKLFYTLHLDAPGIETTFTNEEYLEQMRKYLEDKGAKPPYLNEEIIKTEEN
ncbi:MAG: hypothetical protein K0R54_5400 [Clostridiaceae bacterium]|jgi:prevent-host-death family protein|nr:hypothetical protein [Clostridiaceae bacterium]